MNFLYQLFNHRKIIRALKKQSDELLSGKFDLKFLEIIARRNEMSSRIDQTPFVTTMIYGMADAYSKMNPNNYASLTLEFPDDRTHKRYEVVIRHIGKGKTQHEIIDELEKEIEELKNKK